MHCRSYRDIAPWLWVNFWISLSWTLLETSLMMSAHYKRHLWGPFQSFHLYSSWNNPFFFCFSSFFANSCSQLSEEHRDLYNNIHAGAGYRPVTCFFCCLIAQNDNIINVRVVSRAQKQLCQVAAVPPGHQQRSGIILLQATCCNLRSSFWILAFIVLLLTQLKEKTSSPSADLDVLRPPQCTCRQKQWLTGND